MLLEALNSLKTTDAERREREDWAENLDRAVEYSDGVMLRDTQDLLRRLFNEANSASNDGEKIQPVLIPLLKKFTDESATAYTQGVTRKLVRADTGEQDAKGEELTKLLEDHLEDIGFDETRNTLDRRVSVLRSAGELMQLENGELDPVVFNPQNIVPLQHPDKSINVANQRSYLGFVLDTQQRIGKSNKLFAAVTADETITYEAEAIDKFKEENILERVRNPLRWPRRVLDAAGRPTEKFEDAPVMPFNLWHATKPNDHLIPMAEAVGFNEARMLNVHWSAVLDVVRFQPGALPIWKMTDTDSGPHKAPTGVRFPARVLGGGLEDVVYAQPGNDYEGLVYILTSLAQTVALMLQMSPGDYSLEQRAAMSGFAKLVEKLPQLAARRKKTRHFARMEQRTWPALGASLVWARILPEEAKQYKLITTFEDFKVPRSVDERVAEEKHDIETGFRSPAELLAERDGISIEDAQARIDENMAKRPQPQQQGGLFGGGAGRFAAGVRGKPQEQQPKGQQDGQGQQAKTDDAEQ